MRGARMTVRLQRVLAAIDAANAADPAGEALTYGERMTAELARQMPDASQALPIAARGQHVERWLLPRADYPLAKEGYLAWRREQGRRRGCGPWPSLICLNPLRPCSGDNLGPRVA